MPSGEHPLLVQDKENGYITISRVLDIGETNEHQAAQPSDLRTLHYRDYHDIRRQGF